MNLQIEHLPDRGRFQAVVEGMTCVADYRMSGDVMVITHTEVAPHLEGGGIATSLMDAVVAHARQAGLKIRPLCSFARAYMKRHPGSSDLLAS